MAQDLGQRNGAAVELPEGMEVAGPVIQVDVNGDIAAMVGNQVIEILKLRSAMNQLLARVVQAESERDALKARVEALTSS